MGKIDNVLRPNWGLTGYSAP